MVLEGTAQVTFGDQELALEPGETLLDLDRAEIEAALLTHPAVAECGVVGAPDVPIFGRAMRRLGAEQIIAIGDDLNDVPMISRAGVPPENGSS